MDKETIKPCNRYSWNGDTAEEVYTYLLLEHSIKCDEKKCIDYLESIM